MLQLAGFFTVEDAKPPSTSKQKGVLLTSRRGLPVAGALPDGAVCDPIRLYHMTLQEAPLSVKAVGFVLLPFQLPLKPGLTVAPGASVPL